MHERIWHHLVICTEDTPSFDFKTDDEYWDMYDVIIDTIASISVEYTMQEETDAVHQAIVTLPLEFEEWEDE